MDIFMNILMNVFEFLGIEQSNQIIIFIMVLGFGLMYKLGEMAKWVVAVFLTIMAVSLVTALYQIAFDARAQCIYTYDDTKPVLPESSTRLLQWDEVRDLNCPSLWVARNEIYHRDKYCFYTPRGYSYFASNNKRCNHNVDGPASEDAKTNVKLIARMERRRGCRVPPSSCRDFSRVVSSKLVISRPPLKPR